MPSIGIVKRSIVAFLHADPLSAVFENTTRRRKFGTSSTARYFYEINVFGVFSPRAFGISLFSVLGEGIGGWISEGCRRGSVQ